MVPRILCTSHLPCSCEGQDHLSPTSQLMVPWSPWPRRKGPGQLFMPSGPPATAERWSAPRLGDKSQEGLYSRTQQRFDVCFLLLHFPPSLFSVPEGSPELEWARPCPQAWGSLFSICPVPGEGGAVRGLSPCSSGCCFSSRLWTAPQIHGQSELVSPGPGGLRPSATASHPPQGPGWTQCPVCPVLWSLALSSGVGALG